MEAVRSERRRPRPFAPGRPADAPRATGGAQAMAEVKVAQTGTPRGERPQFSGFRSLRRLYETFRSTRGGGSRSVTLMNWALLLRESKDAQRHLAAFRQSIGIPPEGLLGGSGAHAGPL